MVDNGQFTAKIRQLLLDIVDYSIDPANSFPDGRGVRFHIHVRQEGKGGEQVAIVYLEKEKWMTCSFMNTPTADLYMKQAPSLPFLEGWKLADNQHEALEAVPMQEFSIRPNYTIFYFHDNMLKELPPYPSSASMCSTRFRVR